MKRVLLVLPQGFEILEAAAFFDVLGWASMYGSIPIEVVTAGRRDELRSTFGMRVLPQCRIQGQRAEDFDALAIPGGFEHFGYYDDAYSEEILLLVRSFVALNKPVASICVGALPLARSGVLEGRSATTYGLMGSQRRDQLAEMKAELATGEIVCDDGIITSTCPATAVEVALKLLEMITDAGNAARARQLMGF